MADTPFSKRHPADYVAAIAKRQQAKKRQQAEGETPVQTPMPLAAPQRRPEAATAAPAPEAQGWGQTRGRAAPPALEPPPGPDPRVMTPASPGGRRGTRRTSVERLIEDALAIEAEAAAEAGALRYMARVLVQATMPHREASGSEFTRSNGQLSLSILAPAKVGLPYGSYPRLLLAWLTSEAVVTKSPELELGPSLSSFMAQLDLSPTGGKQGTIPRLRNQMTRLFSSTVSCLYENDARHMGIGLKIAKSYDLWWHPKAPEQAALWKSTVTLSEDFFREIVDRPVPVDLRALKALKQSPIALDTYCWLTYRLSYLKKPVEVSWEGLQMQFGADYSRLRDFKAAFLKQLRAVLVIYPNAKVEEGERGLILKPSRPHIPPPRGRPGCG